MYGVTWWQWRHSTLPLGRALVKSRWSRAPSCLQRSHPLSRVEGELRERHRRHVRNAPTGVATWCQRAPRNE